MSRSFPPSAASPSASQPRGQSPAIHLPNGASWSSLGSQLKTLLTRSPLVTASVAVAAGAGLLFAYRRSQLARRAAHERRRVLRMVKTNFSHRRLDILHYIFNSEWNHFDLAKLERIYAEFLAILPGETKKRGVLPISEIVQLYRRVRDTHTHAHG